MPDFKTEDMQGRHEEERHAALAKVLGISKALLSQHSYDIDGDQVLWHDKAPKGVPSSGRMTTLPPASS